MKIAIMTDVEGVAGVINAHGLGAINLSLLDRRALYSRGWRASYNFGLDMGFDAIIWVGQHAKSGAIGSHLTHTGTFYTLEQRINGISLGEYGLNAAMAGFYGVPAIFAAGERALRDEIADITPWVHTVEVKHGVTRDNGANCDAEAYARHNLGAVHVHPEVARERIYEGAKEAERHNVNIPSENFKNKEEAISFFEIASLYYS